MFLIIGIYLSNMVVSANEWGSIVVMRVTLGFASSAGNSAFCHTLPGRRWNFLNVLQGRARFEPPRS